MEFLAGNRVIGITTGTSSTSSQTTKNDGRGLWNGQPRTELGQQFNTGHVLVGEIVTKVTWRLYKTGSPTGLVYAYIRDSSGTIRETSTTTLDPSTLTAGSSNDSAQEFTFAGNIILATGDMITVQYTGGSSGHEVGVRTDNSGVVTNSIFRQYTGSGEALAYIVTYGSGKPNKSVDGSVFYATDTNKEYVLNSNVWTEL